MSNQQIDLLRRAAAKYGPISPCGGRSDWEACFTRWDGNVVFWFNSPDNSTHAEMACEEGFANHNTNS